MRIYHLSLLCLVLILGPAWGAVRTVNSSVNMSAIGEAAGDTLQVTADATITMDESSAKWAGVTVSNNVTLVLDFGDVNNNYRFNLGNGNNNCTVTMGFGAKIRLDGADTDSGIYVSADANYGVLLTGDASDDVVIDTTDSGVTAGVFVITSGFLRTTGAKSFSIENVYPQANAKLDFQTATTLPDGLSLSNNLEFNGTTAAVLTANVDLNGNTLSVNGGPGTISTLVCDTDGSTVNYTSNLAITALTFSESSSFLCTGGSPTLGFTNAVTVPAGKTLTINAPSTVSGIVNLSGASSALSMTGTTASSFTGLTVNADGTDNIISLMGGTFSGSAVNVNTSYGKLTIQAANTPTFNTTLDVNANTLSVQNPCTLKTVRFDTAGGTLDIQDNVTITSLDLSKDTTVAISSGKTLTATNGAAIQGCKVTLSKTGTLSNAILSGTSSLITSDSATISSIQIGGTNAEATLQLTGDRKTVTVQNDILVGANTLNLMGSSSGGADYLDLDTAGKSIRLNHASSVLNVKASITTDVLEKFSVKTEAAGATINILENCKPTAITLASNATVNVTSGKTMSGNVLPASYVCTLTGQGTISNATFSTAGGTFAVEDTCTISACAVNENATLTIAENKTLTTIATVAAEKTLTLDGKGTPTRIVLEDGAKLTANETCTVETLTVNGNAEITIADGKTLNAEPRTVAGKTIMVTGPGTLSSLTITNGGEIAIANTPTINDLYLEDGATMEVPAGSTWSQPIIPQGDFTLKGGGTIKELKLTRPDIIFHVDSAADITVSSFNPSFVGSDKTLTIDCRGTLTIESSEGWMGADDRLRMIGIGVLQILCRVDFDGGAGAVLEVANGHLIYGKSSNPRDFTLDDDSDRIEVGENGTITTYGGIHVLKSGGGTNIQTEAGSTLNLSATNRKTLSAREDNDFIIKGQMNINGDGGTCLLDGACIWQLADIAVSTLSGLKFYTGGGTLSFKPDSRISLSGDATLEIGAASGNRIALGTVGAVDTFVIDRGDSDHLTFGPVYMSHCRYASDTGATAEYDDINLQYVKFGDAVYDWLEEDPEPTEGQLSDESVSGLSGVVTLDNGYNTAQVGGLESGKTVSLVSDTNLANVVLTVGDVDLPDLVLNCGGVQAGDAFTLTFFDGDDREFLIDSESGNPRLDFTLSGSGNQDEVSINLPQMSPLYDIEIPCVDGTTTTMLLENIPDGMQFSVDTGLYGTRTLEVTNPSGYPGIYVRATGYTDSSTDEVGFAVSMEDDGSPIKSYAARLATGFEGLLDGIGYGGAVGVETENINPSLPMTVALLWSDEDVASTGVNASDLRLFTEALPLSEEPGEWTVAGTKDVGDVPPTVIQGDYGNNIDQKQVWAVIEPVTSAQYVIGAPLDTTSDNTNDNSTDNDNTNDNTANSNVNDNDDSNENSTVSGGGVSPASCGSGMCGVTGSFNLAFLLIGMVAMKCVRPKARR